MLPQMCSYFHSSNAYSYSVSVHLPRTYFSITFSRLSTKQIYILLTLKWWIIWVHFNKILSIFFIIWQDLFEFFVIGFLAISFLSWQIISFSFMSSTPYILLLSHRLCLFLFSLLNLLFLLFFTDAISFLSNESFISFLSFPDSLCTPLVECVELL